MNTNKNNINILNCYPDTDLNGNAIYNKKENIHSLSHTSNNQLSEEQASGNTQNNNQNNFDNLINNQKKATNQNDLSLNGLSNLFSGLVGNQQGLAGIFQGLMGAKNLNNSNILSSILGLMNNFKQNNDENSANILSNLFLNKKEASSTKKTTNSKIDKFIKVEDVELN